MDKLHYDFPRGAAMTRKYWLDLFTGTTWEEFLEHGAKISSFRASRKRLVERISPGDYLLCYLTGISRFIGILEVKSKCYEDATPIWKKARDKGRKGCIQANEFAGIRMTLNDVNMPRFYIWLT